MLSSFPIYLHLNLKALFKNLIISYPYWFLLLAVAAGLAYSAILYFRNNANKLNLFWTVLLAVLRFISVFLLAVLLLSPYVKTRKKYTEKPIVVMGFDNSKSVVLGKDSAFNKKVMPEKWKQLEQTLAQKYSVDSYLFGSEIRKSSAPDYQDELSDYSRFIRYIEQSYNGMNLGAVILAGDGIYNAGTEPVFTASGFSVPFYTIALGDTTAVADARITDVRYNSLVYKDNNFPVEVSISADKLKGKTMELTISAFGKKPQTKKLRITEDHYNGTVTFQLKAEEKGKHRIRISLTVEEGELNKQNNTKDIFVDVFNNAQKILILANSPHPDIAAIKEALKSSTHYKTDVRYIKDAGKIRFEDYNLVILHQIPSIKKPAGDLLKLLEEKEIPVLYIMGKQSSLARFNKVFKGINILSSIGKSEEARADINPLFTLFSFDDSYSARLEELPPMISPLGNYVVANNAEVFAYQKISNISTDFPLILFYDDQNTKSGAILGEGLWLWRMHDYLNNGDFDAFDSFINKTIQYLAARKDKRFFRIVSKDKYSSSENVVIKAELYNASYEPVNTSEVNFKLFNEENKQFNYLFSADEDIYSLDLKHLPVGVYKYVAKTQLGDKKYQAKGEFIVSGQSFESQRLKADHHTLFRLAEAGNGQMIYPDQMDELPEILAQNKRLKKRIYFEEKLSGLNTMPFVIILILFLLSLEWFLRKYFGSY